jgi:adenosine deaminase/adenosine deaminase CECR1
MRQQMQADLNFVAKLHNDLKIDNERFTMRYQNFVLRFMEPVDLFKI